MFSINYGKKVVFNQVDYVKNRSTYLLEQLGIYDLYKNGTSLEKVMKYEWNYDYINNKLDEMRRASLSYLIKGLNDEECC